jgi:UDP-2-acetamido-3-amino-2,3-dideoxy-glucuronate N-acetyltransferase
MTRGERQTPERVMGTSPKRDALGPQPAMNGQPGDQAAPDRPTPERHFFVHESSFVDQPCRIGKGTKIWHFCHIMQDAVIGERCNLGQNVVVSTGCVIGNNVKIQNNVSIYTGVVLEDDVFCGPSAVFTNVVNPRSHVPRKHEYRQTLVKRGASIGANATVVCGITIGRYAFVGAGAVVTRDVPDHALVYGTPAVLRGWMCSCGIKLDLGATSTGNANTSCPDCGRRYRREGGRVLEES